MEFAKTGDSERQGRSASTYAHVTEEYIAPTCLKRLASRSPGGDALVTYCVEDAPGLQSPKNVKVKKMPMNSKVIYATTASRE